MFEFRFHALLPGFSLSRMSKFRNVARCGMNDVGGLVSPLESRPKLRESIRRLIDIVRLLCKVISRETYLLPVLPFARLATSRPHEFQVGIC